MAVTGSQTQQGIDAANRAAGTIDDQDPFSEVAEIIAGKAAIRKSRSTPGPDLCDCTIPGNTVPTTDDPALVIAISPNSADQGMNTATNPFITTLNAFSVVGYQRFLQANPGRQRFIIQNTGSSNLFVVFGKADQFGADITTKNHMKIVPGATYIDDGYRGRIDLASDAAGGTVSVIEFVRQQNVSQ